MTTSRDPVIWYCDNFLINYVTNIQRVISAETSHSFYLLNWINKIGR